MAGTIAVGIQDFEKLRQGNYFYIDKTDFIRQWWESGDDVTLITRPRRFGKTLTMNTLECFFSVAYRDRGELFEGLSIWQEEKFRKLQGQWPVIFLSFADIKETSFSSARKKICQTIVDLYNRFSFLPEKAPLTASEREFWNKISYDMENYVATLSLKALSGYLYRHYGKKVILLLDEYDTPLQEAWVSGYWEELSDFMRSLFNASFKTNPFLERAVMTGITRVSRESIFSDLNNLKIVTTTSEEYADSFGFTQEETRGALMEYGFGEKADEIRKWYDGFTFGSKSDIYNPWSVINFLDTGKTAPYWANTSSNSLVGKLIREGSRKIKTAFEDLLQGRSLITEIDEQIVYSQLGQNETAIWSLLLAAGYLKVESYQAFTTREGIWKEEYVLTLTNFEVTLMFRRLIHDWFGPASADYNDFLPALLDGDVEAMNAYMNRITLETFSFFDAGKNQPERFYHGFVLGLLVELSGRYRITSNRESGFGRYDICLEPVSPQDDAILLEFKVFNPQREKSLSDTVKAALRQIEEKDYSAVLRQKGIAKERIRKYGFAFEGKTVLIGGGEEAEFEASLDEAQKWAASVGYSESDINDKIKSARRKRKNR